MSCNHCLKKNGKMGNCVDVLTKSTSPSSSSSSSSMSQNNRSNTDANASANINLTATANAKTNASASAKEKENWCLTDSPQLSQDCKEVCVCCNNPIVVQRDMLWFCWFCDEKSVARGCLKLPRPKSKSDPLKLFKPKSELEIKNTTIDVLKSKSEIKDQDQWIPSLSLLDHTSGSAQNCVLHTYEHLWNDPRECISKHQTMVSNLPKTKEWESYHKFQATASASVAEATLDICQFSGEWIKFDPMTLKVVGSLFDLETKGICVYNISPLDHKYNYVFVGPMGNLAVFSPKNPNKQASLIETELAKSFEKFFNEFLGISNTNTNGNGISNDANAIEIQDQDSNFNGCPPTWDCQVVFTGQRPVSKRVQGDCSHTLEWIRLDKIIWAHAQYTLFSRLRNYVGRPNSTFQSDWQSFQNHHSNVSLNLNSMSFASARHGCQVILENFDNHKYQHVRFEQLLVEYLSKLHGPTFCGSNLWAKYLRLAIRICPIIGDEKALHSLRQTMYLSSEATWKSEIPNLWANHSFRSCSDVLDLRQIIRARLVYESRWTIMIQSILSSLLLGSIYG